MKTLKLLFAASVALFTSFGAFAANEAKAVLSDSGKTMTFVYDSESYGTKGTDWFSVAEAVAQEQTMGTRKPWYTAGAHETVTKVVFDRSFALYKPTNCYQWFRNFSALTAVTGIENLDVSVATNLGLMFAYCSSLTTLDLAQFDTAKVTSIYAMFNGCTKLTTIYASDKFVTTKLTTPTEQVFDSCTQLVGGNGTKFSSSYRTAERARVDKVDDPGYFTLKEPTVIWDSANHKLTFYFKPAKQLPQGSSYQRFSLPADGYQPEWLSWSSQTVIASAQKIVIDPTFAVYRPTCCFMWFWSFMKATDVEGLSNLDVSRVTHSYGLRNMFVNSVKFTALDLSNFDTRNLSTSVSMSQMFEGCSALKTIYATDKFVVNGNSTDMFKGCSNLTGGNGTTTEGMPTDGTFAKIDKFGQAGFLTAAPVAVWSSDGTTLTFYADGAEHEGKVIFSVAGAEAQAPDDYAPWFYAWEDVTKVVFDDSFTAHQPKHCGSWFDGFCEMTAIEGIENLDTSEATSLYALFNDCNKLTALELGTWDTAKVTDMTSMFAGCSSLKTITVSDKFSTAAVTASDNMFGGCSTNLKGGNGTEWSSDKATDKTYAKIDNAGQAGYFTAKVALAVWSAKGNELLFYYDIPKKIPTYDGQFSVAEAEEMALTDETPWASTCAASAVRVTFDASFADYRPKQCLKWFSHFANLQYITGLGNLNVSECRSLASMFYGCEKLRTLDISGFNTAEATSMSSMFAYCTALESIYAWGKLSQESLTETGKMNLFLGCTNIRGENGTTYDKGNVDASYARVDAEGSKGYFSNPPEAVLSTDGATLTFYADGAAHGGTVYSVGAVLMNEPGIEVPWSAAGTCVTEVKFDSSFRRCRPAHCSGWFSGFKKLTNVKTPKNLTLSNATDLGFLFQYCERLETLNAFTWDTAKVTSMKQMFNGCTSLKKIVASADGFSTAAVTESANMFNGCTALVGGYGTTYDSGKTDATYACGDTKAQKGYFTYPAVAYCNANALTFYCDGKDHGSGVGIEYDVNESAYDVEQDWSSQKGSVTSVAFDPSFVNYRPTSCFGWFDGFALVTSVAGLENLDLSKCEYLDNTFRGCAKLTTLDITTFDTSKVKEFDEMFAGCTSLKTITAADPFSLAAKESAADMFVDCTSLVGGNGTTYATAKVADASYAHVDAIENPGYFTGELAAVAVYDDATKTLTFYYDNLGHSGEGKDVFSVAEASDSDPAAPVVPWSGKGASVTKVVFDALFASFQPKHCSQWFYGFNHVTAFEGLANLDVSKATRLSSMFSGCSQVTTLDLSTWNTANVTHMNNMFYNCGKLANIYVSPDFTTAKVTTTVGKFGTFTGCTQLPNFNPSKTTADQAYIGEGGYLSEKLGPDTAKAVLSEDGKTLTFVYDGSQHYGSTLFAVTDAVYPDWYGDSRCVGVTKVVFDATFAAYQPKTFSSWFNGLSKLTAIEGWENLDTSATESMAAMFARCPALAEVDLSRFNTSTVKSTENMFRESTALTVLDLSSFDTAKVVNMKNMFNGCTALKTIYVSNTFVTSGFSYKTEMFTDATALVGGAGTAYAADHVDSEYARIDTASAPGYFSGTKLPEKIAKPTAIADLVYTATEQTGVTYDEQLQVSGPVKAIKAGEYEATFTLPADTAEKTYQWSDGTTDPVKVSWKIAAYDVADSAVTFADIPDQTYTGSAITPAVTMTFAGATKTLGTDYSVAYSDNIDVGTATATVTGIGNFTGTKVLSFEIVEPAPIQHTVTFNANGGTPAVTTRQVEDGQAVGALPAATREGYTLKGWFDQAEGGTAVTAATIVTADVTYFAQWEAVEPSPKTEVLIEKPVKRSESLFYTGEEQSGVTGCDGRLIVSGFVSAINQGSYLAIFALPPETETQVFKWADGTTANVEIEWCIQGRDVNDSGVTFAAIPDQIYTGSEIKPSVTMTYAGVVRTEGTDYTLTYEDNVNVGTAKAIVTGIGNFTGTKALTFKIVSAPEPPTPEPAVVTIPKPTAIEDLVYTATEQVGVNYDTRLTVDGTAKATDAGDYTATFTLPPNTSETTYKWADDTTDPVAVNWSIAQRPVDAEDVAFAEIADQYYTGSAIEPTVAMTYGGQICLRDTDYTVEYKNNVEIGTATVTVTGKGNFTGTKEINFAIVEAPAGTSVVTFDKTEGAFVTESTRSVENGTAVGALPITYSMSKEFKGWYTAATGGEAVTAERIVTGDVTFYAQWQEPPTGSHYVFFSDHGGKITEYVRFVEDGKAIGELPVATREGYDFAGWFTEQEGGVEITAATVVLADMVVHAQWRDPAPETIHALVGEEIAYKLADLGVEFPDVGTITVKIEGLPKGLKYKDRVIAGTPSETLDFETQTMFARVTTKVGSAKSETLQPVRLQIDAETAYTNKMGVAIEPIELADVKSVSGLPSGLKFNNGVVSGTPKKAGVFTVKLTMNDKSKRKILWWITADDVKGVLGSISWKVEDCAVTVMQGVLQSGWTVDIPAGAKVTISGLPSGLKYKDGKIAGTPTKAGNFVITLKTVQSGVTVTERVSMIVEANEWTGNWYGVQSETYNASSLGIVATVSANGTVKLVYQANATKTTATVKNIDANGTTATLGSYVLDFANGTITVSGKKVADLCETAVSLAADKSVRTYVLEEIANGETNAYAYVTATYNAKKNAFTLSGKLWDGAAVKGTAYPLAKLTKTEGYYLSPVLLTDKAKNAVYLELSDDGSHCRVLENGEKVAIGQDGTTPWTEVFSAAELKGKTFEDLVPKATACVVLAEDGEVAIDGLTTKELGTRLAANGLVKLTLTDKFGWKWVCEMLPVDNATETQFRGIATGTKKGETTQYAPVWSK